MASRGAAAALNWGKKAGARAGNGGKNKTTSIPGHILSAVVLGIVGNCAFFLSWLDFLPPSKHSPCSVKEPLQECPQQTNGALQHRNTNLTINQKEIVVILIYYHSPFLNTWIGKCFCIRLMSALSILQRFHAPSVYQVWCVIGQRRLLSPAVNFSLLIWSSMSALLILTLIDKLLSKMKMWFAFVSYLCASLLSSMASVSIYVLFRSKFLEREDGIGVYKII